MYLLYITTNKNDRGQFLWHSIIDHVFQDFERGFFLFIVHPGDQFRPVDVDPHQNAVPFIPVQPFADRQAGWSFPEHVDHFQLAFLHDHVQSIRI